MTRLAILLFAGLAAAAGWAGAPADDAAFHYLGAWQKEPDGCWTIDPGSQIRFALQGSARLKLHAQPPGAIRVAVWQNNRTVWQGIPDGHGVELNGGESGAVCSILYLAVKPQSPSPESSRPPPPPLVFLGVEAEPDCLLRPPPDLPGKPVLEFIGDSILAGAYIQGRSENWELDSDARLAFPFLLADRLQTPYRLCALPGQRLSESIRRISSPTDPLFPPDSRSPGLVLINIGANERTLSDREYLAGMRTLIRSVLAARPEARVILLNFHRMTPDRWPALQQLARSTPHGRVLCFDARACLTGYSDNGIHPDAASHQQLADALSAWLQQSVLPERMGTPAPPPDAR